MRLSVPASASVTVSGTADVNIARISGVDPGDQPQVRPYPYTYGATFASNTALAANTPQTIFTAAANANGAIVWSAEMHSYSASNQNIALIAKATAPTSVTDGNVLLTGFQLGSAGGGSSSAQLQHPVSVPAGLGLYYIATFAEGGSPIRSVRYTLL